MTIITEILLFSFSLLLTIASFSVVTNKNPVHAVFYLILTFCLSAVLLLLFGVEFLALLFIVVYVGAIAVLFLFVVMMLDLRQSSGDSPDEYLYLELSLELSSVIFLVFLLFFAEPAILAANNFSTTNTFFYLEYVNLLNDYSNIQVVGELLYTFFSPVFILAGYLLLLAMIGSIMLTLTHHIESRKQFSFFQQQRELENAILKYKTL